VASDGIYRAGRIHPRAFGTYPRILRLAVREWRVLSLAQAVHMMTGRTAAIYRVPDRGVIRGGNAADLVVFDAETVSDGATWAEPRGRPIGIEHVVVNGVVVVRDGEPTGVRPGRVLQAAG
jgi:N-acyl-D-amino-acid deacylase